MKANLYEGNGTFRVHDVEIKHPGPHEVRVQIAYCGICGTDLHIYDGGLDYRAWPAKPAIRMFAQT